EMEGWSQREQDSRTHGVHPGKVAEGILLAIAVANAERLLIGIVGHLKVICARRADKADLVVRRGIQDERSKSSAAGRLIVQIRRRGRLQAVITAVPIQ